MQQKKALLTGITGQDGSYLTELLIEKGYQVHGIVRRVSSYNRWRLDPIHTPKGLQDSDKVVLHYGDLADAGNLARLLEKIQPDEIYNLGAQSHVGVSFDIPEYTANVVGLGALRLLEAIRETRAHVKFYQASSSEMFGKAPPPQNEKTPFYPRSPYAFSKAMAYWAAVNFREAYGIHASNGILFNHESPRRAENFVTRKVTKGVAEIAAGKRDKIFLGTLDPKRDWGYAPEYCEAMWRMLQQDQPDDYVVATGKAHSVEQLVAEACKAIGISDWKKYVTIDERYARPAEVPHLEGDISKAREKLGWEPKTSFPELVKIMVKADCEALGVGDRVV